MCDNCLKKTGRTRKENKFSAKSKFWKDLVPDLYVVETFVIFPVFFWFLSTGSFGTHLSNVSNCEEFVF